MGIAEKGLSAAMWTAGRFLPVQKNKIVVTNFYGRGYGDHLKPIVEELLRRSGKLDIVWLTADEAAAKSLPVGVRAVPYTPWNRIRELCTAKVWLDNNRKGARVKKPGQWYLQTWHGFALKRIERDVVDTLPAGYAAYAARDSAQTDLIVSDSTFMSRIYRDAFWYDGEIAEYGSPRNDIFFTGADGAKEKVCRALHLPEGCSVALYAPTFRADESLDAYCVDYERLSRALMQRFGGHWVVLIRLHPHVMQRAKGLHFDGHITFDATAYDDMQELLAASDAVISDYSSLMFDYGLTKRPCFQFAVDIEAYQKDRNFYFPLDKMPFPLAQDNDALEQAVLSWQPEKAAKDWEAFSNAFGMCEDGHASARCADWIMKKMEG